MKQDGKYLESLIQEELNKVATIEFHSRRLPDSFTARGRSLPAQPADFFVAYKGRTFHIEAKTSKETNLRLKMFSQYADMRRWGAAGVVGVVIVHFYTPDRLFLMPVDRLENVPSWKCDELGTEVSNLEEAINTIIIGENL